MFLSYRFWYPKKPHPEPREDPKSRSLKWVPVKYPLVARVPNLLFRVWVIRNTWALLVWDEVEVRKASVQTDGRGV